MASPHQKMHIFLIDDQFYFALSQSYMYCDLAGNAPPNPQPITFPSLPKWLSGSHYSMLVWNFVFSDTVTDLKIIVWFFSQWLDNMISLFPFTVFSPWGWLSETTQLHFTPNLQLSCLTFLSGKVSWGKSDYQLLPFSFHSNRQNVFFLAAQQAAMLWLEKVAF